MLIILITQKLRISQIAIKDRNKTGGELKPLIMHDYSGCHRFNGYVVKLISMVKMLKLITRQGYGQFGPKIKNMIEVEAYKCALDNFAI